MANGDIAAGAGLPTVPGTASRSLGYDDINLTRDIVVTYAQRSGPLIDIYVGPTAPAHAPGRKSIKTTGQTA